MRWFVRYVVDWGFGDYPNYITILIYSAILNQRHRAYLHVAFLSSMSCVGWTMQFIYAQPLLFNMFPSVFEEPDGSYQIYSCQFKFGLPSSHAIEYMSLFVYLLIDYSMHCKEKQQKIKKSLIINTSRES